MRLSFPKPPTLVDSNQIDELSSKNPTTLLLNTHRPYIFNYWTLNDRLRLKNEKLSRRQQSSCRIAFYSLWLCIIASVLIIIIYRFTDDCPLTTNRKQIFLKCSRHWLFFLAICLSLVACSGVLFGACRYFRSQPLTFQNDLHVINDNNLLPMTSIAKSYGYSTNGTPIIPFRQIRNRDDEHSNSSPQRMIPPFNYDEFPLESNSILISKSPNNNKSIFFTSSASSASSPQSIFSTTATNKILNSKATSISEDNCPSAPASYKSCICGIDVWERQQAFL